MTQNLPFKHFTVGDGTRIAAAVHHAAPGQPRFALVHSLAMDHAFWQPVLERLAPHASVLAIDARGHGASDKPAGPYTVRRMAQDLREVVDALGWPGVIAAGASMGGCVALQFAIDHGDRTLGLGLIDTTAWYGPDAAKDWNARAERARNEGFEALVAFQQTRWFSAAFRRAQPAVVDRCVRTFLRNDIEAYAATCRMLGAFDARTLLQAVHAPTAVIVGEEDAAAPVPMAQALHAGIPGSSLQIIPAACHLTPLETPEVVALALLALGAACGPGHDGSARDGAV